MEAPRNPNPMLVTAFSRKGRLVAVTTVGVGFLDSEPTLIKRAGVGTSSLRVLPFLNFLNKLLKLPIHYIYCKGNISLLANI